MFVSSRRIVLYIPFAFLCICDDLIFWTTARYLFGIIHALSAAFQQVSTHYSNYSRTSPISSAYVIPMHKPTRHAIKMEACWTAGLLFSPGIAASTPEAINPAPSCIGIRSH
ncbi:hypothetical protein OE88DRAFT_948183 [Heliocybe sulcata]|uniref:Uncharacterized protein n=1 Tax=Heliocybe sulcata TaxID=5364 RepID=A0A5C3NA43_9AGAM|nr:hypothetical protein OE88DRAFT_948183 [Heliocybe sulcata]